MKKRIAILIISALVLLTALAAMTGCGSLYDGCYSRLSDWRDVALSASSGGFDVYLISGFREQDFLLDGHCGKKIDYTVVTVTPKTGEVPVDVSITAGGKEYTSPLRRHPLGSTYSAEFAVRLPAEPTSVKINESELAAVLCTEEGGINGEDALYIAAEKLDITRAAEIYVRLIENPVIRDGKYYWYVATYDGNTAAVLIDAATGEILAGT